MEQIHFEGVIISAFPFKEYDRIITLFTPDEGLIKLVVKGAFNQKNSKGGTTTPLSHVEVICTKGKSELYSCREIEILNANLNLRQNLATLDAACDLLKVVTMTQFPGKAAPSLYQLLRTYLTKLPSALNPATISSSFRLKTLRHEGLLDLATDCSICYEALNQTHVSRCEVFCSPHAPKDAVMLTHDERVSLEILTLCRDFSTLSAMPIDSHFKEKIICLFNESITH